jgi:ABC-type Fe3+ transport system permease subunit
MSIAEVTLLGAVRAGCVALLACILAARARSATLSTHAVWLLLAAYLMPPILTGYHVATNRADAIGWRAEAQYSTLLFLRVLPLAMLLSCLWPCASAAESSHAHALMQRDQLPARVIWKIRGWWMESGGIFCAVLLVSFQEFDLAACMNARTWTIAVFDAQAGGLALSDSMRLMLAPLFIELLCIIVLFARWSAAKNVQRSNEKNAHRMSLQNIPLLALCSVPFFAPLIAIRAGRSGLSALREFTLIREVGNSFLLALVASLASWLLAEWALRSKARIALLALPGLLGGLILSLLVLAIFQLPPLHLLRGTPLPVLAAMILCLMPVALFLRAILRRNSRSESVFAAQAMGEKRIRWVLAGRPALLAGGLLFLQAYGDFTANSLLAPPALTSAFSRIFNLMHYGRTEILSALLLATLAAPLIAFAVVLLAARFHVLRKR